MTDKSDCKNAILETYVSTESLLPGKSGRQLSGSVPTTGKVSVFKSGDTLVSNIRPYFKKIWYASEDGTCSSDVLVFRAFNPDEAPYLNACLRQDRFFDYVMRGAKGTKMPRGDKKQIMGFPIARSCDAGDLTVLSGLVKQMTRNEIESHRLTELRDVLLPKLMSGEIDVSRVDLTQLNSHLDAPSHRLPGHLTDPLIRVPRRKTSHPRRDLMCRNFSSFPRLGREPPLNDMSKGLPHFSSTEKSAGKGGEAMEGSQRPAVLLVV